MTDGTTFDLDADVVELAAYVPPAEPARPLAEISYRGDAWSAAEIARLKELFDADEDVAVIAERLGRTYHATRTQICRQGYRRNSARPWSEWEDAELVKRYGDDPTADIARDIGRACTAVYQRAALLGLQEQQEPPYSPWEDEQLRAGYAAGVPVVQIAALIGRTFSSVNSRASKVLHLHHANARLGWDRDECARALELAHGGARYREIRMQLEAEGYPERSQAAFKQMMRLVGYGRGWGRLWMEDEDELLRRAYASGQSLTPLQHRLGRSKGSIRWRVRYLGLQGTHEKKAGWLVDPVWTPAEDELLRQSYGKVRGKKLKALFPHRRGQAVYMRANVLGLKADYSKPITEDELRAIQIAYAVGIGFTDLAIAMDRDAAMVHRMAKQMGLSFSDPSRPRAPKTPRAKRPPPPTLAEILAMPAAIPAGPFLPLLDGWRRRPSEKKDLAHAA